MPPQEHSESRLTRRRELSESSLTEPLLSSSHPQEQQQQRQLDESNSSVCTPPTETISTTSNNHVSRNISLILIYTWIVFAGRSIWNQNVLATFAFLLKDGDPKAVGYLTAAMGLTQLIVSLPSGVVADRYRRDRLLQVASVLGPAAIGTSLWALHRASYSSLVISLCGWGAYWGVANTAVGALFADSIPDGQRSHYFTQRSILINVGNVTGPLVALIMFAYLGDDWTLRDCSIVMAVGQLLCLPALVILCWLDDDDVVAEEGEEEVQRELLEQPLLLTEQETRNHPRPTTSASQQHQDETYDAQKLATWFKCFPEERAVPLLIATADVSAGLAAGMSVRYFAIFLYDNLHLNPVIVQVLYVLAPLLQATLMKVAQYFAKSYGRCRVTVIHKWIGVGLMFAMIKCYQFWKDEQVWLVALILVVRTGFMNSTSALTRSVLMDHVPSAERAKWSALESLNMFSWSGAAALGGLLVDAKGILFNFSVTVVLQLVATLPLLALSLAGNTPTTEEEVISTRRNVEEDDVDDTAV